MPRIPTTLTTLGTALFFAGIFGAQAAEAPYYNPSNAASSTGKTIGYELNKTIGCPGRALLDTPCKDAMVAKPAPKIADGDGDGVPDDQDRCPNTPRGAKVNANGCELDGDNDGVVDRLDQCPTTPAGRKVNAQGCELDGDGDGVVDALDKCPTTPPGRKVNAQGCELDGDGDGVVDALDKCPTTPAGRKVNAQGCELDTDGDGIIDALDQCPDTPAGDRVDSKGCSLPKVIILKGVNFDFAKDELLPSSASILDEAVSTLKRYPGLRVEIAGHTDHVGSDERNLNLSERRAKAVMDYFVNHGVAAERLNMKGYGESEPVADNRTPEGRSQNRRVELRPLN